MEKVVIILLGAIFCTGCTMTRNVVTSESFKRTNYAIKESLKAKGYIQTDKISSKEFDGTISTNSSERTRVDVDVSNATSGNVKARTNSSTVTVVGENTINTYCFEKPSGETVEYKVSYSQHKEYDYLTAENVVYLTEIQLIGCSTSNKNEYDEICGDYGLVANKIEQPIKQTISIDNPSTPAIAALLVVVAMGLGALWVISMF